MQIEAPREGLKRSLARLHDIRISNREIPLWKNKSRQVQRAEERAERKRFVSGMKTQLRRKPKKQRKNDRHAIVVE